MNCRTGSLLLIFAIAFLVADQAWTVELYRSNAVGIRGERLNEDSEDQPEFVLEVSYESGMEIRRLLEEGIEIHREEISRDGSGVTERVYEDGELVRETVRDSEGRLLSEIQYTEGAVSERSVYEYEDGFLASRSVYSADDSFRYREAYSYWRDGSLRSIVKEEEGEARTEYRYRNGRLEEEWISRPGESERFEFDAAGRLVMRELFSGGTLIEQEVRIYRGLDSGSLLKQVIVSSGDTVTTRDYDERGRLVGETLEDDGVVVRRLERTFSEDLLVSETEVDSEGRRSWQYEYSDHGERVSTSYREDGELVEIEYSRVPGDNVPGDSVPADRVTELYNRGELVLRIYYEGRTRLREEVIRDGEVVQVRDFLPETGEDARDAGDGPADDGSPPGSGADAEAEQVSSEAAA